VIVEDVAQGCYRWGDEARGEKRRILYRVVTDEDKFEARRLQQDLGKVTGAARRVLRLLKRGKAECSNPDLAGDLDCSEVMITKYIKPALRALGFKVVAGEGGRGHATTYDHRDLHPRSNRRSPYELDPATRGRRPQQRTQRSCDEEEAFIIANSERVGREAAEARRRREARDNTLTDLPSPREPDRRMVLRRDYVGVHCRVKDEHDEWQTGRVTGTTSDFRLEITLDDGRQVYGLPDGDFERL
jgi:hypothetical protein